jgi:hypothetical protein
MCVRGHQRGSCSAGNDDRADDDRASILHDSACLDPGRDSAGTHDADDADNGDAGPAGDD